MLNVTPMRTIKKNTYTNESEKQIKAYHYKNNQ